MTRIRADTADEDVEDDHERDGETAHSIQVTAARDRCSPVHHLAFRARGRCYQPRSARRCGWGISSTLMPTMASPSPRETSAMTFGSS